MAILNYSRPLLEVIQQLEITKQATGEHLHACVLGENFALYRYGKEELNSSMFTASGGPIMHTFEQELGFEYKVDIASVRVFAEGLDASLATLENELVVDPLDVRSLRVVGSTIDNPKLVSSLIPVPLLPELHGAPLQIGDAVYIRSTVGANPRRAVITELLGVKEPSAVVQNVKTGGFAANPITVFDKTDGEYYKGYKTTTYTVQCTAVADGVCTVRISDTAGIDFPSVRTFNVGDAVNKLTIGTLGVVANIPATATYAVGDMVSIICTPVGASETMFDGIRLDTAAVDVTSYVAGTPLAEVELVRPYSGEIDKTNTPDSPWTADATKVTISPNASMFIEQRTSERLVPFRDYTGKLFVEMRVLIIPEEDEEIFELTDTDAIQEAFGTIAPENPLAFGCYTALNGAAGRKIYAIRTRGPLKENYEAAMKKTESDTFTYTFAPMTNDLLVQQAVVEFNAEMSAPSVKKWRRTIVGVQSPGQYVLTSTDTTGHLLRAAFVPSTGAAETCDLVQLEEGTNVGFKSAWLNGVESSLHAGDILRLDANGNEYVIKQILSDREALLVEGPNSPIESHTPVTFIKADTKENTKEFVISYAKAFNTRRALVAWTDNGVHVSSKGVIIDVNNQFLAADIAGISSAVVPQKSITHTEVTAINRAPRMYLRWSNSDLDEMAREGVLIVTQDNKRSSCYIRHQLTTETDKGNMYFEDSCTRNIDNISYAITDAMEGYIGRANVTPSALRQMRDDVSAILIRFSNDSPDPLIGPSLVRWDNLSIVQDPVFKDRVIVKVNLYLPLPLNNIRVYEMAYIANVVI